MPSNILIHFPPLRHGVYSGVGRYGLSLVAELLANGRGSYTLRADFARSDLPELFERFDFQFIELPKAKRSIVAVGKVWMRDLLKVDGRFDAVLNLDPLGTIFGGRFRITIVHDLYFRALARFTPLRERIISSVVFSIVFRRSRVVAAISDSTLSDLGKYFPWLKKNSIRIYSDSTLLSVEDDSACPKIVSKYGRFILVVANNTPNKNLGVVCDAVAALAGEFSDLTIVHVGVDEEEILKSKLSLMAGIRVVRLHRLSDQDMIDLYRSAELLCVPSLYEGFCLPIVEAQKLGCPVVFSNRSASGEVGGSGGVPFDPSDYWTLVHALRAILKDPILRGTLATLGYANAERFSWSRAASDFEALLFGADHRLPPLRARLLGRAKRQSS